MFSFANGHYHYSLNGRVRYAARQVGFLVDVGAGTVLEHGELQLIWESQQRAVEQLRASGQHEAAERLVVVEGGQDLSALDAYLEVPGLLARLHLQRETEAEQQTLSLLDALRSRRVTAAGQGHRRA